MKTVTAICAAIFLALGSGAALAGFTGPNSISSGITPIVCGTANAILYNGGGTVTCNANATVDSLGNLRTVTLRLNANTTLTSGSSGVIQFTNVSSGDNFGLSVVSGGNSGQVSTVGIIYNNAAAFFGGSKTTLTNGAGASVGTLTNAPAIGNPTKWIAIDDNGTTRQVPAW